MSLVFRITCINSGLQGCYSEYAGLYFGFDCLPVGLDIIFSLVHPVLELLAISEKSRNVFGILLYRSLEYVKAFCNTVNSCIESGKCHINSGDVVLVFLHAVTKSPESVFKSCDFGFKVFLHLVHLCFVSFGVLKVLDCSICLGNCLLCVRNGFLDVFCILFYSLVKSCDRSVDICNLVIDALLKVRFELVNLRFESIFTLQFGLQVRNCLLKRSNGACKIIIYLADVLIVVSTSDNCKSSPQKECLAKFR